MYYKKHFKYWKNILKNILSIVYKQFIKLINKKYIDDKIIFCRLDVLHTIVRCRQINIRLQQWHNKYLRNEYSIIYSILINVLEEKVKKKIIFFRNMLYCYAYKNQ